MPVETFTSVPSQFTAGDTVRMLLGFDGYTATDWTLSFRMKGLGGNLAAAGVANGTSFDVVLTHSATAALGPGPYIFSAVVTAIAGGDVRTLDFGNVNVYPDPTNTTIGPRRAAFEAARDALATLSTGQRQSVSVEGLSYSTMDVSSLSRMVDRLEDYAIQEDKRLGLTKYGALKRITMTI